MNSIQIELRTDNETRSSLLVYQLIGEIDDWRSLCHMGGAAVVDCWQLQPSRPQTIGLWQFHVPVIEHGPWKVLDRNWVSYTVRVYGFGIVGCNVYSFPPSRFHAVVRCHSLRLVDEMLILDMAAE